MPFTIWLIQYNLKAFQVKKNIFFPNVMFDWQMQWERVSLQITKLFIPLQNVSYTPSVIPETTIKYDLPDYGSRRNKILRYVKKRVINTNAHRGFYRCSISAYKKPLKGPQKSMICKFQLIYYVKSIVKCYNYLFVVNYR